MYPQPSPITLSRPYPTLPPIPPLNTPYPSSPPNTHNAQTIQQYPNPNPSLFSYYPYINGTMEQVGEKLDLCKTNRACKEMVY